MIEWVNAVSGVASLITLGGVATLIGLILHLSKEWKDARDAEYKARHARFESELAEKNFVIKQLQANTYSAGAEASTTLKQIIDGRDATLKILKEELDKTQLAEQKKAELLERMKSQISSEQRVLNAVVDIGSGHRRLSRTRQGSFGRYAIQGPFLGLSKLCGMRLF